MDRFIVVVCAVIICIQVNAQSTNPVLGARNLAVGGASVAVADPWGIFNNPGTIGLLTEGACFFTYVNRYNLEAFQIMAAGAVIPFQKFNLAIGGMREGDDYLNRQQIKIGISNTIQMVSLGGSISWKQYAIEGIGMRGTVLFDFGGTVEVIPKVRFGAYIFNFTQTDISGEILIPVILKSGINYQPVKEVSLLVEIEKDIDLPARQRIGLSYAITPAVAVRTGFVNRPTSPSFGLGFNPGKFRLDYCFQQQNPIGSIHECSLTYLMGKK